MRTLIFLALTSLFLSSCALRTPLPGLLYSQVQGGLTATAQSPTKEGIACASSILGLVATGDASIETARKNGGILSIASVDETYENLFIVYAKHCTIVRGK